MFLTILTLHLFVEIMILNNPGPSTCKFDEFEEYFNLKKVKT